MRKGRIEFEKVNKIYQRLDMNTELTVIENLNLTVAPGDFVSIVGTSGCGKSTLLRMIAGLETPTTGRVLSDGEIITGPSPDRGLVFQDHTLFPWLTVKKNMLFALKASKRVTLYQDQVDLLLEKAGLSEFAQTYPHQLSGGMRQRVALIRSLVTAPDVLLLDEPLGALDSFTRMTLQDELIRLWKARENTMILITHDIDEAIYLSNKIIVMSPRPGRIIETIDIAMTYPRNRAATEFEKLRTHLLKKLDFAQTDEEPEYYL